ncbi:pilus assembly PilX N-terminal domain-containing protein [Sporomusa acidovorans]|uniref:Type 4 fimbrial biogenesis protein PilX N-terminal domain-containing protein n=1 Tax=Sporomusa acidovorans (strain ATCC 49682 / DSM 3132 / Mol) TaxID=1123286 RepID=A0ABZ3J100_SPOA4|nr:pilus assembly PilX N-terminal domain-containing protein [Sporomusa acidovorans]OZC15026.1 hypothetical protein SPACI_51410 [Sporomusa acidovorans DSM 3132]SDE84290.1 PilX N-terminal [Sporomusa acidovorans]
MFTSQRGAAALMAILVMTLLLVIGSGLARLSLTDVGTAGNYRDGLAAQYLAEAGAKRALSEIRRSETGEWPGETREFDMGNYEVKANYEVKPVVNQGMYRIITAIGTVNRATRTVVVTVTSDSPFHYAAFSGKHMRLSGVAVDGDIGSNGDITLTGGKITGRADATGEIYAYDVDAARLNPGVSPKDLPPFTSQIRQNYKAIGKMANIREDDSQRYVTWGDFSNLNKNVFYVEAQYPLLLATGHITGPGVIYCTEEIRIAGATISNNVALISEKNIKISEGIMDKSLLIAGGDVEINIADYRGGTIAYGNLSIAGNGYGDPKLEAAEILNNAYLPFAWASGKIQIMAWNSHE